MKVHVTTCHGKFTVNYTYDHIWQVTVNRNSEDSWLIHNFQPWQQLSFQLKRVGNVVSGVVV